MLIQKIFFSLLNWEYKKLFLKLGDKSRFNKTKQKLYYIIKEIREYISLYIQSYSNNLRDLDSIPIPVCESMKHILENILKENPLMVNILQKNKPIWDLSFIHLLYWPCYNSNKYMWYKCCMGFIWKI